MRVSPNRLRIRGWALILSLLPSPVWPSADPARPTPPNPTAELARVKQQREELERAFMSRLGSAPVPSPAAGQPAAAPRQKTRGTADGGPKEKLAAPAARAPKKTGTTKAKRPASPPPPTTPAPTAVIPGEPATAALVAQAQELLKSVERWISLCNQNPAFCD